MNLTSMSPLYSTRFDRALQFSAKWHDNQYRKGSRIPYIVHPVAVGFLLRAYGYGESIQIAGLLHDIVEDTACTLRVIEEEFGTLVSETVHWCTELSKEESWESRKDKMIEQLRGAPLAAKAVACADKSHNLNTILDVWDRDGDEVWSRFSRGTSQQLRYYQRVLQSIGSGFSEPILSELEYAVQRFEAKMDHDIAMGKRP
tara:strand:- start:69 stop:671 length:603 start_codon:yes stop_codon:yes gene_type:complete